MSKFIRVNDGSWVNIAHIRSFYIGGDDEVGYRICFNYEFNQAENRPITSTTAAYFKIGFMCMGKKHKSKKDCQKELDILMETV